MGGSKDARKRAGGVGAGLFHGQSATSSDHDPSRPAALGSPDIEVALVVAKAAIDVHTTKSIKRTMLAAVLLRSARAGRRGRVWVWSAAGAGAWAAGGPIWHYVRAWLG